jgi:hypothetical protein
MFSERKFWYWTLRISGKLASPKTVTTLFNEVEHFHLESRDSSVSTVTRLHAGSFGRSNPGRGQQLSHFQKCLNRFFGPLSFLFIGYHGYFPRVNLPGRQLTTHLYLVSRLRKGGAIFLPTLHPFMPCTVVIFYLTLYKAHVMIGVCVF